MCGGLVTVKEDVINSLRNGAIAVRRHVKIYGKCNYIYNNKNN